MNDLLQPTPEKEQSEIKIQILNRARWLYFIFVLIALTIIGRIVFIQYGPEGSELRQKAVDRRSYRQEVVEAKRGDIFSHDFKLLATSIPMYEIRMDFNVESLTDELFHQHVDSLAYHLSDFFKDRSQSEYKNLLMTGRANAEKSRYVLLSPRRVNFLELQEIARFPIFRMGRNRGGFIPVQVNRRLRPNGNLASRTIGMVNAEGVKVGIEGAFDKELRGVDGTTLMQKISGSFWIPVESKLNSDPVNGIDVVTTLDIELQDVAEKALKEQLEKAGAIWGTAILMEVSTGAVRAIANLKKQPSGNYIEDYNYGIGMSMEPGSTFKLITLMALLDDAGADINEKYETGNGRTMIGRARVVDATRVGYGTLTLKQVFEKSSNIGFAKAINKYYGSNPQRFTGYISSLGIDKPYGLQIPGEAPPVFRHPGDKMWNGLSLTMMSYGYALMMTPIHTLSIFNAVANDGKMMKPLFVSELRQNGQVIQTFEPQVMNPQICTPSTLAIIRETMEGVVEQGTAKFLQNDNYTVGAKTGTAQVAKGRFGYSVNGGKYYLATLAGYFPADNPKYTCIIAIETFHKEGSGTLYYGGSLSGPVFRAIADKVYAQSVDWQREKALESSGWPTATVADVTVPVKNGDMGYAGQVFGKLGIDTRAYASSGWTVRDSGKVHLRSELPSQQVPDVTGMGLIDALYALEKTGLTVLSEGKGQVQSQTLPAGTPVVPGDTVKLFLSQQ